MWLNLAIRVVITALKEALKNPVKKQQLKKVMLELYMSIKAVYSDDPDFP